ncbi:hypothetical protein [Acinetobacter phage AbTZA1]|uniref:Uncharacterized protein n=1 Tax=Acinetobacter phage AbTZA1 TaxID=2500827 RepID=A0A3Q9R789_9CAUD|nr:hypothetical protein HYP74_gp025 [Acinetobacter phage AbTZA1]AZU98697.1 hypothetical protein [Acinetobacter phage AbTZA1]
MYYDFYDTPSDDRAIFANSIFKYIYQKYNGNFKSVAFQIEAKQMDMYLTEYCRNIYEVIDNQIPMMSWVNYLENGYDATMFDEGEMTEERWLDRIYTACKKYYK